MALGGKSAAPVPANSVSGFDQSMRHYKTVQVLELAEALASSAEGLTLDEMAKLMKVNRRTVERMRDAVAEAFKGQLDPVSDGREKRFRLVGGLGRLAKPPSRAEMAELQAAIDTLDKAGASARAGALRSLGRKIAAAERDALRKARLETDLSALADAQVPVHVAGIRPIINQEDLELLREAILRCCRVKLIYKGDMPARVIEPYGFLWGKGPHYLVGREAGKPEPYPWRIDRMSRIELVDEAIEGPPEGFSLAEFAERSFGVFQEEPRKIRLRFDADAADAARQFLFHPKQKLRDLADGRLEVTFTAGGLLEIARHVFTWGGSAEIVEPPELREMLLQEIDAVAARHRTGRGVKRRSVRTQLAAE